MACQGIPSIAFGGERVITNTCSQNYKFEGKERDTETGNDDFGARYYTSRLGRWLSADWSAVPAPVPYANLTNPQTLNLYAMVSDNPETFADLDGHQDCGNVGSSDRNGCLKPPNAKQTAVPGDNFQEQKQKNGTGTPNSPTQTEILTQLNILANQYRVPEAVVIATAQTENNLNVNGTNNNYKTDANGNKTVSSTDYGLMQVNSKNIGQSVMGSDGRPFTIGVDVKTDWKANAEAGVAILAADYKLAVREQPGGSTLEDHAQQAYSAYNGGPSARDRYLTTGSNGLPSNSHDARFLVNYQAEIRKQEH